MDETAEVFEDGLDQPQPTLPEKTVGVELYDEARLPGHTLIRLWSLMMDQGFPDEIFTRGEPPTLNRFVRMFTPSPYQAVWLAYEGDAFTDLDQVIGMVVLNDLVVNHRATIQAWFRSETHGTGKPLEAMKKVIGTVLKPPFGLQLLVATAHEHNPRPVRFLEKLGFRLLGDIPNWFLVDGRFGAATVVYLTPENFSK